MHGHYGVIGQTSHKNTDFFLFWPEICFLKRAKKKKRVYATLRFSRVNFNRCHPRDHTGNENTGTDTVVYVCKLLEDAEGQQRSATLAKSKFK